MVRFIRRFIRPSAFLRAEIFEILRQPRLILTLVLGPFLILLLFGIGYRNVARALRTLFVAPEGSAIRKEIEEQAGNLGPQLVFLGVTADQANAQQRLRNGEVDVVAVAPSDPYETIRSGQQAVFTLYHNEIDPLQAEYVRYFGEVYVNEVNRRLLRQVAQEGQSDATTYQAEIQKARASAKAMREALERGDTAAAKQQQGELDRNLSVIELGIGASLALLGGTQEALGPGGESDAAALQAALAELRQNTNLLGDISSSGNLTLENERAKKVEDQLAKLEARLSEFRRMNAQVLVSPFRAEAKGIAPIQPRVTDYFAPSVIVLLLQHLAVTFAALSIVRERRLGTMELFRVSPLSAGETLIGKYLSYLIFGGFLAAILTAAVVFLLGVPMLGNWWDYVGVVAALLFTALGYGFVISLIAETESHAVQYAMLLLLMSVFFTGFFLQLQALEEPVRLISWTLPATYAISMLQSLMLRGYLPGTLPLMQLTAIGGAAFILALLLLRQRMARA